MERPSPRRPNHLQMPGSRPAPPQKPPSDTVALLQPVPDLLQGLQEWIGDAPDTTMELVVILFVDSINTPRLPRPTIFQRQNPNSVDSVSSAAESIIDSIAALRTPAYERIGTELADRYGGEVTETFWITKAVIARMPIGGIRAIATWPTVISISPLDETAMHTAAAAVSAGSVGEGRREMASDSYKPIGPGGGTIGLVDQLPDLKHDLVKSRVTSARDCLLSTCPIDPDPTASFCNHGTKSAAVLSGDATLDRNRGVTAFPIHAWSVFENGTFQGQRVCNLRKHAVLRALAQVHVLADVVVLPFQMPAGASNRHDHVVAVLADKAFDAGAVVIAAVGNGGNKPKVVPGLAHKVISVGGHVGGASIMTNNGGVSEDGRGKPDVLAPTNKSIEGLLLPFTHSSGATAFAGGAAALLRIWLEKYGGSTDPGQTYAYMILSGQLATQDATTITDNRVGAGRLRLPTDGRVWWGKIAVKRREQVGILLKVPKNDANAFDIALWWPEGAADPHSDIDAYLIDETGHARASGRLKGSVFERARHPDPPDPGDWKLCIHGFDVEDNKSQTVYWAAAALER